MARFGQERVSQGLDLPAVAPREEGTQYVFVQELEGKRLFMLRNGDVTNHVGEHYRSESSLAFYQPTLRFRPCQRLEPSAKLGASLGGHRVKEK
jgi:hypothetical protein